MKTYLIDGNNLIGKIRSLMDLQSKDRQGVREKLAFMIDNYFTGKNAKVLLFYDGYENLLIRSTKSKIIYSQKKTADDVIKNQIGNSKNPRQIVMISSDNNLIQFASVCGCETIKSEKFAAEISAHKNLDDEEDRERSIDNNEIKKLFGV
ncbi:MAG: NYN domain-containing protein [Ignavibacteriales bacterium]|nr:NYN domain-containing protein [Ignavibacteriales bacterium]